MKTLILILCILQTILGQPITPKTLKFRTKLDHTTAGGVDDRTFNIRYLVNDKYFTSQNSTGLDRPILFYAGNEGDIEGFYDNTGFVTTTLAEKYGALVVYGEHRYFGHSFPSQFSKEDAFKEGNNAYLTVENTMMDYVELIKQVRKDYNADD